MKAATVKVSLKDVEPVKGFIAHAAAAHAAFLKLTPQEYDALPEAARLAARTLRDAVAGLIGEGLITVEAVEDLVSEAGEG